MKTIRLMDIVAGTGTNNDGLILKQFLRPYFYNNESIRLSFEDSLSMSSSFFNSSFGELINEFGVEKFKDIVIPCRIKMSHLNLIREYIRMHVRFLSMCEFCN